MTVAMLPSLRLMLRLMELVNLGFVSPAYVTETLMSNAAGGGGQMQKYHRLGARPHKQSVSGSAMSRRQLQQYDFQT
jgi:hypothetical protein